MTCLSVDIFCRVVDNFGDVGVSWRLAKQFATEHGFTVRYIVDNLEVFKKFSPGIKPGELGRGFAGSGGAGQSVTGQIVDGVLILLWDEDYLRETYHEPAQVVLEMFGGGLPAHVISHMSANPTEWIDVQYLSAEDWVPRFHAIPSFEPSSNLERTLFFPGFSGDTGGLLRESGLLAERDAFQGDVVAQNLWRTKFGLPAVDSDLIDTSFFSYQDAPLGAFIEAVRKSPRPVRVFLTAGVDSSIAQRLRDERDALNLYELPFLSQSDYDRLLWSCDLNLVRGEDSWTRAIWSGRPFLWHIYRQEKNAHFRKLSAFLKVYTTQMEQTTGDSIEKLMFLWNEGESKDLVLFTALESWAKGARDFVDQVALQTDLATRIMKYVRRGMPIN